MKNSTDISASKILSISGLFLTAFLLSSLGSASEGSPGFEIMCRNKAKEIAAETYKGCMTENRQTQLDQIRKEYKEELSNLKNQYDKKLKKLSGGSRKNEEDTERSAPPMNNSQKEKEKDSVTTSTIELRRTKVKASRTRLPNKKVATGTQVIDLSKPIDSQINDSDETTSQARIEKKDALDNNETELVELANQQ